MSKNTQKESCPNTTESNTSNSFSRVSIGECFTFVPDEEPSDDEAYASDSDCPNFTEEVTDDKVDDSLHLLSDSAGIFPRKIRPEHLTDEQVKAVSQYYEGTDQHTFKVMGFWLIVGCLAVYGGLSLYSTLDNKNTSAILDSFVDLLKYIIPTLIGFVFANSKGSKPKSKDSKNDKK